MMQSILLVGLVALVPLVASSCCLPSQWEGKEGFTVGQVMPDGTTSLSQGFMNISVDATMKKIALNMSVATDTGSGKHKSEMFILQDFVTKTQYVVQKGMCKKSSLADHMMFSCIPSNATVVMKTKVGSDHTPATIYHISFGKMGDGYMTVTDNGCIPVLYQVTADINGAKTMESVGMYDITTGIRDMSVFTLPKICRTPGTVINTNMPPIKIGI